MIRAEQLTFRYADSKSDALSGLSFHLPKGAFGLIEAGVGAGKSTLIKLLMAREAATGGELEVAGTMLRSVKNVSAYRRSIGVLSNEIPLINDRTVGENVLLPLELTNETAARKKQRLTETLHRFALDDLRNTMPQALSEGERRRAMLARALIHEPMLLIADEPTLALDPASSQAIWDLLYREHQRGMTILAATSAPPVDAKFEGCQRIALSPSLPERLYT